MPSAGFSTTVDGPGQTVTEDHPVHARGGHTVDRPPTEEILVLCAPEELTRLITDALPEFETARDPPDLAESVRQVLLPFRPPPTSPLLAAEPVQLSALVA